jgi:hypothetical protein
MTNSAQTYVRLAQAANLSLKTADQDKPTSDAAQSAIKNGPGPSQYAKKQLKKTQCLGASVVK